MMYGEEDPHFVPAILETARKYTNNTLYPIDNVFIRCQLTYVGNVAWAILKAKDKLLIDKSITGEAFFITDDTPLQDPFDYLKPIVEANGLSVSKYKVPYWLLMIMINLIYLAVAVISPLYEVKLPEVLNKMKIKYLANTYFFNRNKAIIRLDYDPLFTPEESEARASEFYKKLTKSTAVSSSG